MALTHAQDRHAPTSDDLQTSPIFALEGGHIPRHTMPEGELPPDVAYQIIHDELMIDGEMRLVPTAPALADRPPLTAAVAPPASP